MLSNNATDGRVFNIIMDDDIKYNEREQYCGSNLLEFEHGHWGEVVSDIFRCGVCARCKEENNNANVKH